MRKVLDPFYVVMSVGPKQKPETSGVGPGVQSPPGSDWGVPTPSLLPSHETRQTQPQRGRQGGWRRAEEITFLRSVTRTEEEGREKVSSVGVEGVRGNR